VSLKVPSSFFDDYPLFYGSSKTSATSARLAASYSAIIKAHQALIGGSRVLDLASHDGRWSFAALAAGAAHVVGIEARQELVANACANFAEYAVDPVRPSSTVRRQKRGFLRATPRSHEGLRAVCGKAL
jgi:predicted RNA methylase